MEEVKTININKDLHHQFKVYCVTRGMDMKKTLEDLIKDVIDEQPKPSEFL